MRNSSRREFTALALAALGPRPSVAQSKSRLILLGTAGGPRPRANRGSPAQVIVVNNTAYVIDCGNGVARQLVRAGIPLAALRHVFITHQHSDHNADYGNLLLIAWTAGLRTRVDTWGPPPLTRMTSLFFQMNDYDIRTRIADEGRVPLVPLVHPHQITRGGLVTKDENVTVTAALVDHPPVAPAFAYRFDMPDRSIVISGDTKRSEALIRLAQGADVLVHEAMYPAAIDRLVAPLANAAALKKSILSHHTRAEDVGSIAAAAGVKTLVLSHFVPAEDAGLTDQMWIDAVRATYQGRIILGTDLLEI
ncbi:MAG: tat (twin-arginine translocation) pathway signal sequence domain protein [Candidatus Solibacter sp.]|nr:tat (twin-arginine translocation) pathway signal sequence domain protein [Candidatus Solibacter sp.]